MASGWQKKVARVSRMDWEEVRTRVGQELHKRGDLLRHKLGRGPEGIHWNESSVPAGKFFFAPLEAAQRADLIRQHLPEAAAEIVRQADEICEHRFQLLGYENLDFGAEIDWHLDRVHGKRAPMVPWPEIPFLDFAVVGDHKVIWELNRHQHLVTLAKAWRLTKDEKYVRELFAQWRSWNRANPYPLGINWGSTLEIAFRSLSWIWVDQLLTDAPGFEKFRAELRPALAFHGRYIERYLSTYFSPNTHLLGEAVAMFFLGTLYPQIPHAARWNAEGWKIVLHEAERQVRPDGVYFEQSLHYHVYALDFFLYARQLAAVNDMSVPAAFDGVLLKMLNVLEALAQAGVAEGFGDDDGGRVFDPRRNQTEHMTDPLALGAIVYRRDDAEGISLTEEAIWLFGERAIAELEKTKERGTTQSIAFPNGGLYVLADSLPRQQVVALDAGPQGVGRCGHGHADALSLRLTMNGSRWLVDSGSGVYISADPKNRDVFRGTSAHNTLRVDGLDQAIADEPFSWTNIPITLAETWFTGETFSYFVGSHDGYTRLADPVTHRRSVLKINGDTGDGISLVRDSVLGAAEHDLELHWHFASNLEVREGNRGEVIATRPNADGPALRLLIPEESGWKVEATRGLLSPAYGQLKPAPLVRCGARIKLPAEIATALITEAGATQACREIRMVSMPHTTVQVYELQHSDEVHGFFFAQSKQAWSFGPWSSDAELLYCRIRNEKLVQLIIIGGSSVQWQGQILLSSAVPSKFLEWRKQDGIMHAEPDAFTATQLFEELAGVSLSSTGTQKPSPSFAEKH